MQLDFPTLGAVFMLNTAIFTALLFFAWALNRQVKALAWWGLAFLLILVGMGLMVVAQGAPTLATLLVANSLLIAAYSVLYGGCRAFNARPISLPSLGAGVVVWWVAFPFISDSSATRLVLTSVLSAGYALMSAWELWRHARHRLASHVAAIILLLGLVGFNALRGALGFSLAQSLWIAGPVPPGSGAMAIGIATFMPTIAFVFLSMAKEQREDHYKRAALIDPLTRIPNRRAFLEGASALMSQQRETPTSCLLFDLDNFKQINDPYGHKVGDHVLEIFGSILSDHVPGGVYGRLGGEEFSAIVCLDEDDAGRLAEHIRHSFESIAKIVRGQRVDVTVSVGCATGATSTVKDLLRQADTALYRAKAQGRNVVVSASAR
ncbi:GGDEF domain-containing protein [Microvirga tunisiensis]|uniref:diguanylate cyclase n=1 Tax=Microvirga tunisiensis TaxID=2108360 RepID=A0A5N7MU60_9HYPH|nr:GGDEF domain-containing protein [Microvirga tunisiensis]MPR12441.1 GGDEF domain-containing protein [Microvirga tunisiensis]MPR30525.1 GGDEF domain-containing protein [Microvirga tunisiensis]